MMSSVPVSVHMSMVIILALSANLSKVYAMEEKGEEEKTNLTLSTPLTSTKSLLLEEVEEGLSLTSRSPNHRYQLITSEGRESYTWALEQLEKDSPFKLKHTYTHLPTLMDFGPELNYIHTQGDLGSCTAQSMTLSLEYSFKKLGTSINFSPLFVYYNERLLNNTIDNDVGASLTDGLHALYMYGACQECTWSYSDDKIKFKQRPTAEAYRESRMLFQDYTLNYQKLSNDVELIKQTLARKIPVVCGINIFPSFEYDKVEKTGKVLMPKSYERPIGAHALTLVGYNDETEEFKFANSWGPKWGDNGFGYLPYNYITNNNRFNQRIHTYPHELWSIDMAA